MTDVLVVTTTVRMLDGVHRDTSHSGPVALLGVGLVVRAVSLQKGLVSSLATSDDSNHSSAATLDGLTHAGRKSDSSFLAILGVTDHDSRDTRGAGKNTAVAHLCLNIGNNGALRHCVYGEDVANSERGY